MIPMNDRNTNIYVFSCSNSIEPDQLVKVISRGGGVDVRVISLPCSGKIDIPYLMKAFETGADGAVIVTCPNNECRHLEGNLRAQKRSEAVESLLEEIGLGKGRMSVVTLKEGDVEQGAGEIRDFVTRVKKLPMQEKNKP
jgi:F420-non-reducing hydrogenase iron-sulfur subunit